MTRPESRESGELSSDTSPEPKTLYKAGIGRSRNSFKSGKNSNVILIVENKEIAAHKTILASNIFQNYFTKHKQG